MNCSYHVIASAFDLDPIFGRVDNHNYVSLTAVHGMGCLCCKRVEEERRPLLEGTTVNISYTTVVVYNDSVVAVCFRMQGHFCNWFCL